MPSHLTFKWLAATSLLASLACFHIFSADHNCGAQSWDCATLPGIALASVVTGLGLGLFLTAGVVLLGWCYIFVKPSAPAPESNSRAGLVAVNLVILHLLVSGFMEVIGILPLGWVWWLGAFGAVGMHPPGTFYIATPSG